MLKNKQLVFGRWILYLLLIIFVGCTPRFPKAERTLALIVPGAYSQEDKSYFSFFPPFVEAARLKLRESIKPSLIVSNEANVSAADQETYGNDFFGAQEGGNEAKNILLVVASVFFGGIFLRFLIMFILKKSTKPSKEKKL